MTKILLIAGTTSNSGKSTIVAGLCRLLIKRGLSVAPFKAQNMSNNSIVTEFGEEIGRAQAVQAYASGLNPSAKFNPILLKPEGDSHSQLVIKGKVIGTVNANTYFSYRKRLNQIIYDELNSLKNEFDIVICEGAGSPSEINLRNTDLANMGLAQATKSPVIVVGDINYGGLLAHLYGTVAILPSEDQKLIVGFIINKFLGDVNLLKPGLQRLQKITGRPVYGIVPFIEEIWLDSEDTASIHSGSILGISKQRKFNNQSIKVAAIKLPRISNSTDLEALACEPNVEVQWVTLATEIKKFDLVIIPGSKSTISDLAWLHRCGIAQAILEHAKLTKPILGLCGGFQMLCSRIKDSIEYYKPVSTAGLNLLDIDVEFKSAKTLKYWEKPFFGYEIHHGKITRTTADDWLGIGFRKGATYGTHLHGLFDNDNFRRDWIAEIAYLSGHSKFVTNNMINVRNCREKQIETIASLLESHLDINAIIDTISSSTSLQPNIKTKLN